MKTYSCLALAAREHGLAALDELVKSEQYKIIGLFTHRLNPKSYDASRQQRLDFGDFAEFASRNSIPLYTVDSVPEKEKVVEFAQKNDFDFIVSVSWRYLVPPEVFNKPKIAAINLHRGDLPKYAGAEPILKALKNNETEIAICAHYMTEKYDEGDVICKARHPVNYDSSASLEQNVERLKKEITPHFGVLAKCALEDSIRRAHDAKY